jgi:alcohol dehydrogenase class IV
MFETNVDINRIVEIRCKTTAYLGVGAIKKMSEIAKDLRGKNIDRVLVVTGKKSYKFTGAWDYVRAALEENSIEHTVYDRIRANPTVDMIDEATQEAKQFEAKAVVSIGGGSPIDAAKSVAILAQYPENDARQLYMQEVAATKALPLVAINLTHGTGTEVDRFAVATIPEKQFKPVIAFDCIYPLYSIDDPVLTMKLPEDQTRFVTIDALNHVTEAATTTICSPYSVLLAKETVQLIAKYLPAVLSDPKDLTARYFLLYASALAGISFDNSMLHLTHALEHPLSAMKPEIPHGLGLATILPSVLKATYPYASDALAEVYSPIVPDLKGLPSEADEVARMTEAWLSNMGVPQKLPDLGFEEDDIPQLVSLAFETPLLGFLIGLSPTPVELHQQTVRNIYEESFQPYKG